MYNSSTPNFPGDIYTHVNDEGDVVVEQDMERVSRPSGLTKREELQLDHPGMGTHGSVLPEEVPEKDDRPRYPNGKVVIGSAALRATGLEIPVSTAPPKTKTARERAFDDMALVEARRQMRTRRGR